MRNVYSVGQITDYIASMFRQDMLLGAVLVRGEVSNCTYHSSGHIYFTLKDEKATLSCVMFRGSRSGLKFPMKAGDRVVVAGSVEVYSASGRYQLYAAQILKDGAGDLAERYEALKAKLEAEGLFDAAHKKPIPTHIRRLGVITAPTGAAVRDIIQITRRRNPGVEILLYPALVQGEGAAPSLVKGLTLMDALPEDRRPDVIILGRGGGSLEDLWAFNEEIVARAVYAMKTPVISAVGHETDTALTDFVADLRAPTPSAGAEMAVFRLEDLDEDIRDRALQLRRIMDRQIRAEKGRLTLLQQSLKLQSPQARIREQKMRLAQSRDLLEEGMLRRISDQRKRGGDLSRDLNAHMENRLKDARQELRLLSGRLDLLSPLKRLSRGFGFVTEADGRVVESAGELAPGTEFRLRLRDGKVLARSLEMTPEDMESLGNKE